LETAPTIDSRGLISRIERGSVSPEILHGGARRGRRRGVRGGGVQYLCGVGRAARGWGGGAAAGVGGGLVRGTRASDEKIQVRWRLRML